MQLGKMLSKAAKKGLAPAPYLANRNVQWDLVDLHDLEWMDFSEVEREKYKLQEGDLLVCEGGEVGRTALWRGEREGVFFQKAIHRLRVRDGVAASGYLLRFMRLAADTGLFTDFTSQTSIAHLTQEQLAQVQVDLPPLPEQRRIAEILDAADQAIRGTEAVIAKLRSARHGLLDGLIGPTEASHLVELRTLCKGPGSYGSPVAAQPHDPNLPRYVRITDITDAGLLSPEARASIPEEQARPYILEEGDLLFARSGATVGKTYLYREADGRCAHAGYVIRFKIDQEKAAARFIFLFTQTSAYLAWVKRTLRQGAQPNINAEEYGTLKVPCPLPDAQRRATAALDAADRRLLSEVAYLAKLKLQKQGVMQDLLSGRVRVAA